MRNLFCFLFLGTLGWGVSLYLIKILLVSLSPSEIVLYRMAIGALTLSALAIFLKLKIHNLKSLFYDGVIVGTFNMTIPIYLTSYAEIHVTSSLASILNGLTPLFTFLLGIIVFSSKQKFSWVSILSILLGFTGIVVIHSDVSIHSSTTIDLIALIITSISYAVAANYFKYYARTQEPVLVAGMSAIVSTVTLFVYHLYETPIYNWHIPTLSNQLLALFWLGAVGSGVSLYLYCYLIKQTGAVFASMITYLMAVTGVFMGVFFLGETFSTSSFIGCICLVLSLILINHQQFINKFFKRFRMFYDLKDNM